MSHVLGIDFDTRAVHLCLLDDDTNQARYVPAPIRGKQESAFDAARNVRSELLSTSCVRSAWSWDDIYLVGIEDSMYRSPQTVRALARVQGAILASIPRGVAVVPVPCGEWKKLTVGRGDASKDYVADWASRELPISAFAEDGCRWPQDAFDAYCIARAVRDLNDRARSAA